MSRGGRPVVITGMGAISPLGATVGPLWEGLLAGRCGIGPIRAFDPVRFACRLGGEAPEYKLRDELPKAYRKAAKLMSRDIELSIVAANEALRNAGIVTKAAETETTTYAPERMAINFGAGLISCDLVEIAPAVAMCGVDGGFDIRQWGQKGMENLTPIWLLKYLPNMLACHVGIIHDIRGPSNTITTGETAGAIAVCEAADVIARGDAEMELAGGCEAKVNPIVMLRQCLLKRATFTHNDQPETAVRPFDSQADGSVFGEAGAAVVLEEEQAARKRGAKILAEVAGFGSSSSMNPVYEHMEPDGRAIELAIREAMEDAGVGADAIDLIVPCGLGVPQDDRAEATAIAAALGSQVSRIPCWPIKGMVSATGAAAGVLDLIAAVLAMRDGRIGPAKNCDRPFEGCKLNLSNQARPASIRHALCCSYSFGGQAAAIVLRNRQTG